MRRKCELRLKNIKKVRGEADRKSKIESRQLIEFIFKILSWGFCLEKASIKRYY